MTPYGVVMVRVIEVKEMAQTHEFASEAFAFPKRSDLSEEKLISIQH
jgi:hypothetical protein